MKAILLICAGVFVSYSALADEPDKATPPASCGCPLKLINGQPFSGMEWKEDHCYLVTCKPGACTPVPGHVVDNGGEVFAKDGVEVRVLRPKLTHAQCVMTVLKNK
ncbi:hypothetical protein WDW37_18925 [Bdellovibrionota bacterium FG-1]